MATSEPLLAEIRALIARRSANVPSPVARALAPEAPLWVVLILVVPVLAVGIGLTTGIRLGRAPYVDNDYWWHLATGEWILEHRAIPMTDPFSWTHGGQGWVAHEWLAEIILALAVRAAGYTGVIVLTAVVAVAGFWRLLAGVRAYGLSRRAIAVLMLLWGGPFIRENVLTPRPQLWSFALFAVLLAALAEYDTGRRRALWVLPPLFAIWINVNLTALIGIACLGAFVLDRLLRRSLDRHLLAVGVLSGAALLVNPSGLGLAFAVLEYANPGASRYTYIWEWMPPRLTDPTHIGFLLALPLVPIAVVQLLRGRVWPALPVLALAYESFTAVRFIPLFMMLAFIFAGWLTWRRVFGLEPLPVWTPLIPRTFWSVALAANAAPVAAVIASVVEPSQLRREPLAFGFPVETAAHILENYPDARIYNAYDHGGYLIHRFDGEQFVFIDGREEMYGEEFMQQYWALDRGDPGWQETFDEAGINLALVRRTDGLRDALANDPAWERVAADETSILFLKSP